MACETSDWMLGISHCLPWPEPLGSGDGNKFWLNLCIHSPKPVHFGFNLLISAQMLTCDPHW